MCFSESPPYFWLLVESPILLVGWRHVLWCSDETLKYIVIGSKCDFSVFTSKVVPRSAKICMLFEVRFFSFMLKDATTLFLLTSKESLSQYKQYSSHFKAEYLSSRVYSLVSKQV